MQTPGLSRTRTRITRNTAIAAITALILGSAACTPDDGPSSTTTESEPTTATTTTPATTTTHTTTTTTSDPSTSSSSSTTTSGTTDDTTGTTETTGTTDPFTGTDSETDTSSTTDIGDPCEMGPIPACCEQNPLFPGCPGADECMAPAEYAQCDEYALLDKNDPLAPFYVLGLGCPDTDATDGIQITDAELHSVNVNAWQIARGYGDYHLGDDEQQPLLYSGQNINKLDDNDEEIPEEYKQLSETILLISTGVLPTPNDDGVITALADQDGNGNNGNSDNPNELPEPMTNACGSQDGACGEPFSECDGVGDCSDTIELQWALGMSNPNDMLWLEFKTTVPPNTEGYNFKFAFFSSEWPTFVDTPFNDLFIGWQVSEAYTGNTTYLKDPNNPDAVVPLTTSNLAPYLQTDGHACLPKGAPNCAQPPELAGTGFETHAGTEWLWVHAPAVADEELHVMLFIADMSDSILATTVALDGWHWRCNGCALGDTCGVELP